MRRFIQLTKRIAWSIAIIGAIILMIRPAILAYEWIAWHVWTKEFQAVCTHPSELNGDDIDHYYVIDGPYTAEFWDYLRDAFKVLGDKLEPEWADWQADGTLRVPVGFDLQPDEKDAMTFLHDDRRPRERSHVLASYAVIRIFQDRLRGHPDLSRYQHLAYSFFPTQSPPVIQANTCGFMEQVITVGGALAREDTATGERP